MEDEQNSNQSSESGDPGRTPGAAEGDLETVEADLQEKSHEEDAENFEKTKEKKIAESTSRSSER